MLHPPGRHAYHTTPVRPPTPSHPLAAPPPPPPLAGRDGSASAKRAEAEGEEPRGEELGLSAASAAAAAALGIRLSASFSLAAPGPGAGTGSGLLLLPPESGPGAHAQFATRAAEAHPSKTAPLAGTLGRGGFDGQGLRGAAASFALDLDAALAELEGSASFLRDASAAAASAEGEAGPGSAPSLEAGLVAEAPSLPGGPAWVAGPALPAGRLLRVEVMATWGDPGYVGLTGIEVRRKRENASFIFAACLALLFFCGAIISAWLPVQVLDASGRPLRLTSDCLDARPRDLNSIPVRG